MEPVVPLITPEVAPSTHAPALQVHAYPVDEMPSIDIFLMPSPQLSVGAPLPLDVDVPGS